MKDYPNPHLFLENYLEQAEAKRQRGMERAGLKAISPTLHSRLIERDIKESKEDYIDECCKVLVNNIDEITRNAPPQRGKWFHLDKEVAHTVRWIYSFIIVASGLMAWHFFSQHDLSRCAIFAVNMLVYLILILLISLQLSVRRR